MGAEQTHGLAGGGTHGRQPDAAGQAFQDGVGGFARMDQARGNAKRPGRGRDQERTGFQVRVRPVAGGELVLDQPVGGCGIRNAQQRLRQHHEGEPLLGRQRIGVQEILDAADAAGASADRLDQADGERVDPRLGGRIARLLQPRRRKRFVRGRKRGPERRNGGACGRILRVGHGLARSD